MSAKQQRTRLQTTRISFDYTITHLLLHDNVKWLQSWWIPLQTWLRDCWLTRSQPQNIDFMLLYSFCLILSHSVHIGVFLPRDNIPSLMFGVSCNKDPSNTELCLICFQYINFSKNIINFQLNIRTPPYTTNISTCFIVHSLHYMFRSWSVAILSWFVIQNIFKGSY
jgi:hypothetical protein